MKKKRILMVCEAFGGGVFTYVSQLCNDMVDEFDVYLAYSLRPQTPKNYTDFLDQRVHLIGTEMGAALIYIVRVVGTVVISVLITNMLRKIRCPIKAY